MFVSNVVREYCISQEKESWVFLTKKTRIFCFSILFGEEILLILVEPFCAWNHLNILNISGIYCFYAYCAVREYCGSQERE